MTPARASTAGAVETRPADRAEPAVASAAPSALKVVFCLRLVCLFTAISVAVLKCRLSDIDRVLSRTLAYAVVTRVLAGAYAGLVLLATQVLRLKDAVDPDATRQDLARGVQTALEPTHVLVRPSPRA